MGNSHKVTDLFVLSLRDTLIEVFDADRYLKMEFPFEERFSNGSDYIWSQRMNYIIPHLLSYLRRYFNSLETPPKSVLEQYKHFNFGSDEEEIYPGYPLSNFYKDIQYDLFTWVASELLFRRPLEFTKQNMSLYYPFENKSSLMDGLVISEKVWQNFFRNKNKLTNRLIDLPMPPHFLLLYSQNIDPSINKKKRIKSEFRFLTESDLFSSLVGVTFDTFLKFEKNEIPNGIIGARKSIFTKEGSKKSPVLLDALVEPYIERAFNPFLAKFAAYELTKCNLLNSDDCLFSYFLKGLKLIKSTVCVYSKVPLLKRFFSNGFGICDITKGVTASIGYIANQLLEKFSHMYEIEYGFDPIDALDYSDQFDILYEHLSIVFNDLFNEYVQNKKHNSKLVKTELDNISQNEQCRLFDIVDESSTTSVQLMLDTFDDLDLCGILSDVKYSRVKAQIMRELVDPNNVVCDIIDTLEYCALSKCDSIYKCIGCYKKSETKTPLYFCESDITEEYIREVVKKKFKKWGIK